MSKRCRTTAGRGQTSCPPTTVEPLGPAARVRHAEKMAECGKRDDSLGIDLFRGAYGVRVAASNESFNVAVSSKRRWNSVASVAIFVLALGVRIGYWSDGILRPEHGYPLYHAVRGVPFSDAQSYDLAAEELASGRDVPTYWRARRPIYSYLLALTYVWTGPSWNVATLLNQVAGAATTALIYVVLTACYGPAVGLTAALWCAVDPEQLAGGMVVMTEPIGLLLTVAHLAILVRRNGPSDRDLIASGLLLAASNLTRSLTLFSAPGAAIALFFVRTRAGGSWRDAWRGSAAFLLAVIGSLLPFMLYQYYEYGIFSLQDTTASHLYAAASPDHEVWDADIETMADEQGLTDVRSRYQFLMRKARENIVSHPADFARKFLRNALKPLRASFAWLDDRPWKGEWYWLGGCFTALWLAFAIIPTRSGRTSDRRVGRMMIATLTVAASWAWAAYHPASACCFFAAVATCRSLRFNKNDPSFLLINQLLAILAALGLFAFWDDRFLPFLQWLVVGLFLGGISIVASRISGTIELTVDWADDANPASRAPSFGRARDSFSSPSRCPLPRWGEGQETDSRSCWIWLLIGLIALSTARIGYRRWTETKVEPLPVVTQSDLHELVALAHRRHPKSVTANERDVAMGRRVQPVWLRATSVVCPGLAPVAFLGWWMTPRASLGQTPFRNAKEGELVVRVGLRTRFEYYFPRGATSTNTWRYFTYRPYERTVFRMSGITAGGETQETFLCVFPGDLRGDVVGRSQPWLLVGRLSIAPERYREYLVEGLALAPWDKDRNAWDVSRAHWGTAPAHARRLEALARAREHSNRPPGEAGEHSR